MEIMKKLIFILILFSFAGCVTQQRCQRKFPPVEKTHDSIVTRIVTVTVHDTIPIPIEPDTILIEKPVYVKDGVVNSDTLRAETDFAKAWAAVVQSSLKLGLMQKDSTINRIIQDSIKTSLQEHYHTHTIIKEKIVYKVHWYDKAARSIAGGVLIIVFLFFGVKFLKTLLKP